MACPRRRLEIVERLVPVLGLRHAHSSRRKAIVAPACISVDHTELLTVASAVMVATHGLKVDGASPASSPCPERGGALERRGYDGCWTGEINHDPFLPLVLAAEHTSRIELGTSIAVAFARNPMTVANLGWDLQAYSRRPVHPGSRLAGAGPHREAVQHAVESSRAAHARVRRWRCGRSGRAGRRDAAELRGRVLHPQADDADVHPEPQPYAVPKVFIAAVGEAMTEMCGEVADGLLAHAFTTRRYLDEVTTPALLRGLAAGGPRPQRISGVVPGVRRHRRRRDRDGRRRASAPASRSRSTGRRPPTAGCSTCTAGATCTPSCTGCRRKGLGRDGRARRRRGAGRVRRRRSARRGGRRAPGALRRCDRPRAPGLSRRPVRRCRRRRARRGARAVEFAVREARIAQT